MSFVYRCLATENPNKPFAKRCKEVPAKNGILCKDHMNKARKGKVYVLMHNEVSKIFGIPFRNQVCVSIDLSGKNKKPESKSVKEEKIRHTKNHLREKMQNIDLMNLKIFHDSLNMNCWDKLREGKNEYAFKYLMIKKVIDKFLEKSCSVK